jgi:hypothetical protein
VAEGIFVGRCGAGLAEWPNALFMKKMAASTECINKLCWNRDICALKFSAEGASGVEKVSSLVVCEGDGGIGMESDATDGSGVCIDSGGDINSESEAREKVKECEHFCDGASDISGKAGTEDGIDKEVGLLEHEEVLSKGLESGDFEDIAAHGFEGVEMYTGIALDLVSVAEEQCSDAAASIFEVSCDDVAITAVISGAADDNNALGFLAVVEQLECFLGAGSSRKLHEDDTGDLESLDGCSVVLTHLSGGQEQHGVSCVLAVGFRRILERRQGMACVKLLSQLHSMLDRLCLCFAYYAAYCLEAACERS